MTSTVTYLRGICIATGVFLLTGCAQLTQSGNTEPEYPEGASSPITVSAIDLSSTSSPVVAVEAWIDGQPAQVCLVHRIASSIEPASLGLAIQNHLANKRDGLAINPLQSEPSTADILTSEEAGAAYDCVSDEIANVMAISHHAVLRKVPEWQQLTVTPFFENQLGGRYAMVYANDSVDTDTDVGAFVDRGIAVGGILATPSFSVDKNGIVSPGPIVLAEKMPRGFTSAFGNYRYTIIDAKGDVVAVTNGANKEMIALCDHCTDRGADRLYLALLNGGIDDETAEDLPVSPRAVYEDAPLEIYGAPPSAAFKSPEPGSLVDPLEGEVLDPDAAFDDGGIDPSDLEVDLDPSVDLLAE